MRLRKLDGGGLCIAKLSAIYSLQALVLGFACEGAFRDYLADSFAMYILVGLRKREIPRCIEAGAGGCADGEYG